MLDLKDLERKEFDKRDSELCLIASENYPSEAVLEASGSIFQCKYAEGFPNKRYYQGCEVVDEMEQLCINKCLELFNADKTEYCANVQPNSGASANMIVYNAVLNPGDVILSMDTSAGGHISHGHPKSFLSKYFNVQTYGVNDEGWLDYNEIEKLANTYKPKLIICGASNYSRKIDFKRFRQIADGVGAILMADIAHISLLVAKGFHQSPVGIADFITSTTHKQLAGPRGAFIIYRKEFDKQIKLSTIPGLFGGPLENQIYAKLQCFEENLQESAMRKAKNIIRYAKVFEDIFKRHNIPLLTGGTDNHLMTINLTNFNISGKEFAKILEECGIIVNCNAIPNDKRSFLETSGIRLGVPALVTRDVGESCCELIATYISDMLISIKDGYENLEYCGKNSLKNLVKMITKQHPLSKIYPKMYQKLQ